LFTNAIEWASYLLNLEPERPAARSLHAARRSRNVRPDHRARDPRALSRTIAKKWMSTFSSAMRAS
jgi:hypothetical protein